MSRLFQSSVPDDRPVPTPCKWQVGKVQPGRTAAGQARQVVLAAPPLLRLAREEGSWQLGSPPMLHPRRGGQNSSGVHFVWHSQSPKSPIAEVNLPPVPCDPPPPLTSPPHTVLGRPTMASLSSVPVQRTGGVRRMAACACMPAAAVNAASATPEAAKSANFNYKHAVAPQMGGEVAVLALG